MDEGVRTRLQARPAGAVRTLRVEVELGADVGRGSDPDGASLVTVGSSPDNALVLSDPLVSRYHLELRRAPDGIAVSDLGSTNGTWLSGTRLREAVVPPGSRLHIGETVLRIDDAGARARPPAESVVLPGLVAVSEPMRELARAAARLTRVTTSVLIEGETGAGKEVVARAIHDAGPRRDRPFLVVDCGALPATLIASQLFGHERGAFTGADAARPGAFERADGGTLLLDEIGELPLDLQPALLGVIERRRFCRVGGSNDVEVDVRVLAATNRDLRAEVNAGSFRADLYYRLAVARLQVPPLRQRPEDLQPLIDRFVEAIAGAPGANPLAGAMEALRHHRFPGNVRELRNLVEAALVLGRIDLDGGAPPLAAPVPGAPLPAYRDARAAALAAFEADYLRRLLEQSDGNVSEAARRARMDRPYLSTLLKKHGLR